MGKVKWYEILGWSIAIIGGILFILRVTGVLDTWIK